MKKIIAKTFSTPYDEMHPTTMRVIQSDHPRFEVGTRFDFGFQNVAIREGYAVEILPIDKSLTAIEYLIKHWYSKKVMKFDETTEQHLQYAIDAIQEAIDDTKKLNEEALSKMFSAEKMQEAYIDGVKDGEAGFSDYNIQNYK